MGGFKKCVGGLKRALERFCLPDKKKHKYGYAFFLQGGFFGGGFSGFLETRAFSAFFGVLTADFR